MINLTISYIRNLILLFSIVFFYLPVYGQQRSHWKQLNPTFDSIAKKMEEASFYDRKRTSMKPYADSLYLIAEKNRSDILKARSLYWKAWIKVIDKEDSADILLRQAQSLTDSVKYSSDYHRILLIRNDILRQKGAWLNSYRTYKKLEQFFSESGDWFYLAKTYIGLACVFQELKEYEKALFYFNESERLFLQLECMNCVMKNKLNISNLLYRLGHKEQAINTLNKLITNPIVIQDTAYMINVLISHFSMSLPNNVNGESIKIAYRMAQKENDKHLLNSTKNGMGVYYLVNNKIDSALVFYKACYKDARKTNNVANMSPILKGMIEAYQRINRIDSAYKYIKIYTLYQDSVFSHNQISELNRLESRAAVGKYELALRNEREKTSLQRNIVVVFSFALLCLICFLLYIFYSSRHKEEIMKRLRDSENREYAAKLKEEALEKENYRLEVDLKNRELTSNTLINAKNNHLLKELLQLIQGFSAKKIIPAKEANELIQHIKVHLVQDDGQNFNLHFKKVYPDFYTKLKAHFPGLTENDLRMCAYIRIGMSTKEIAQMLSVLPETVHTIRYRIRKKMELQSDVLIEDFLRSI